MVNRKARCGWATHKQTAQSLDRAATSRSDPQNCNVYIGNVSQEVADAQLRQNFEPFGTVTDVKIYRNGTDPRSFRHFMGLPCGPQINSFGWPTLQDGLVLVELLTTMCMTSFKVA